MILAPGVAWIFVDGKIASVMHLRYFYNFALVIDSEIALVFVCVFELKNCLSKQNFLWLWTAKLGAGAQISRGVACILVDSKIDSANAP
jgi:hypothetical protein